MFLNLSFAHWLVVLSAVISIAGAYSYIKDTLIGKTKPNRVSWFMWAIAPLIGTGAAISSGADLWVTVRIFLAGFIPLIVLIASFVNAKSYWKVTKFDVVCGACSFLALIVWFCTDSPQYAILVAAVGDGFAALPTIIKAWKYPDTENGKVFIASLISVLLVIPSIPTWNIENSSFQIYLIAVNSILIFSIYRQTLFYSDPT
ncbi:MAG: hypothetical protein R3A13_10790 [Bdellovibrionota bacterium]